MDVQKFICIKLTVYKTDHFQTAPKPWGFSVFIYLSVYCLSCLTRNIPCALNGEYTSAQREKHYHSPNSFCKHCFGSLGWFRRGWGSGPCRKTTIGMATHLWIWSCSRIQVCGCFAFIFFPPSAPSTLSLKPAFVVQRQNWYDRSCPLAFVGICSPFI